MIPRMESVQKKNIEPKLSQELRANRLFLQTLMVTNLSMSAGFRKHPTSLGAYILRFATIGDSPLGY